MFQENDPSVRLKIASLLGLLSKTAGFSPDCIMDDAINILQNESKLQFKSCTFRAEIFSSVCIEFKTKYFCVGIKKEFKDGSIKLCTCI